MSLDLSFLGDRSLVMETPPLALLCTLCTSTHMLRKLTPYLQGALTSIRIRRNVATVRRGTERGGETSNSPIPIKQNEGKMKTRQFDGANLQKPL